MKLKLAIISILIACSAFCGGRDSFGQPIGRNTLFGDVDGKQTTVADIADLARANSTNGLLNAEAATNIANNISSHVAVRSTNYTDTVAGNIRIELGNKLNAVNPNDGTQRAYWSDNGLHFGSPVYQDGEFLFYSYYYSEYRTLDMIITAYDNVSEQIDLCYKKSQVAMDDAAVAISEAKNANMNSQTALNDASYANQYAYNALMTADSAWDHADWAYQEIINSYSPDNPTFSNAVKAVGLGVDTNIVIQLSKLMQSGGIIDTVYALTARYIDENDIVKHVLKERTGQKNEFGTGYGYMLYNWNSDIRSWALIVPHLSASMTTSTTEPSTRQCSVIDSSGNQQTVTIPWESNPLVTGYYSLGTLYCNVSHTDGLFSTNACKVANFDLRAIDMKSGTTSPTWKAINASVSGVTAEAVGYSLSGGWRIDPAQTITMTRTGIVRISGTDTDYSVVYRMHGFSISGGGKTTTASNFIQYEYVVDADVTFTGSAIQGGTQTIALQGELPWIKFDTMHSQSELITAIVPFVKMANIDTAHYYYDQGLNCTFEVAVSNGCFYSVKVSDGDLTHEE